MLESDIEANLIIIPNRTKYEGLSVFSLQQMIITLQDAVDVIRKDELRTLNAFGSGRANFRGRIVENYNFTIFRRYTLDGDLHVGGLGGEIVNVDESLRVSISAIRERIEEIEMSTLY